MRSKEVKEAIELLHNEILSIKEGLEKGWYYGERYNLEQEIKKKETILNYISELEEENTNLKEMYIRTARNFDEKGKTEFAEYMLAQIEEIPTFTTWEEYITWVSKDKVRELKEKVHKTLDANGITRAYQIFIDKDFEELLGEQ